MSLSAPTDHPVVPAPAAGTVDASGPLPPELVMEDGIASIPDPALAAQPATPSGAVVAAILKDLNEDLTGPSGARLPQTLTALGGVVAMRAQLRLNLGPANHAPSAEQLPGAVADMSTAYSESRLVRTVMDPATPTLNKTVVRVAYLQEIRDALSELQDPIDNDIAHEEQTLRAAVVQGVEVIKPHLDTQPRLRKLFAKAQQYISGAALAGAATRRKKQSQAAGETPPAETMPTTAPASPSVTVTTSPGVTPAPAQTATATVAAKSRSKRKPASAKSAVGKKKK